MSIIALIHFMFFMIIFFFSLNATDFLERLRGKKLVFVGDSLNRNMWESLVCILRHSLKNKNRVYEISGKSEFKKKGIYAFRFEASFHYNTPNSIHFWLLSSNLVAFNFRFGIPNIFPNSRFFFHTNLEVETLSVWPRIKVKLVLENV